MFIIADYMKTAEYLTNDVSRLIAFIKGMIKKDGIVFDDETATKTLNYLFSTEKEYIENFYQTAEEKFGTFEKYIYEGLGLTHEETEQFRAKYLE